MIKLMDAENDQFYFTLVANNGETVQTSKLYDRKDVARKTADAIKDMDFSVGDFTIPRKLVLKPKTKKKQSTKQEAIPEKKETPIAENKPSSNGVQKISIEEVRKAVQAKAQSGKKDAIKGILSQFNAKNVTAITVDQYPEFLQKIESL